MRVSFHQWRLDLKPTLPELGGRFANPRAVPSAVGELHHSVPVSPFTLALLAARCPCCSPLQGLTRGFSALLDTRCPCIDSRPSSETASS